MLIFIAAIGLEDLSINAGAEAVVLDTVAAPTAAAPTAAPTDTAEEAEYPPPPAAPALPPQE